MSDPHSSPQSIDVEPIRVTEPDSPRNGYSFVRGLGVANLVLGILGGMFHSRTAMGNLSAILAGQSPAGNLGVVVGNVSILSGLACAVLLVIGGVGLLRFSSIGRIASLWYVRISLATTAMFVGVVMVDLTRNMDGAIDADEGGVIIFGIPFILVRLFYPLLLYLSLRTKTVSAYLTHG